MHQGRIPLRWLGFALGMTGATVLARALPYAAPFAATAGMLSLAGVRAAELARIVLAVAVMAVPSREVALACSGLVLMRSRSDPAFDGPSLGWGALVAGHAAGAWFSPESAPSFVFWGIGAFLIGGIWPFTGSWVAREGWGRRLGRGLLSVYLLAVFLPAVNPVAFDAWAPWLLFLPGLGIVWCAAQGLSPSGQRSGLSLLWFFEFHMIVLFCLGTRGSRADALPLLLWASLLPVSVATIFSLSPPESTGSRLPSRIMGMLAVLSLMALPGTVGFAARFLALSGLLFTSPAALICFAVGLLIVPVFLRPLRDEMRSVSLSTGALCACGVGCLMLLVLGIAPGLIQGGTHGIWLWGALIGR